MNNLEKKVLEIISRRGNPSKEMKVTPSKLGEVSDGIIKADFVMHKDGKYLLTKKGERKIKK